jgi:hypothetical protein
MTIMTEMEKRKHAQVPRSNTKSIDPSISARHAVVIQAADVVRSASNFSLRYAPGSPQRTRSSRVHDEHGRCEVLIEWWWKESCIWMRVSFMHVAVLRCPFGDRRRVLALSRPAPWHPQFVRPHQQAALKSTSSDGSSWRRSAARSGEQSH